MFKGMGNTRKQAEYYPLVTPFVVSVYARWLTVVLVTLFWHIFPKLICTCDQRVYHADEELSWPTRNPPIEKGCVDHEDDLKTLKSFLEGEALRYSEENLREMNSRSKEYGFGELGV